MHVPQSHRNLRPLAVALLVVTLAACGTPPAPTPSDEGGQAIAPEFKAFWSRAGGLTTFGPALSAPWNESDQLRQTFLAGEMIYRKTKSGGVVSLAPLGTDLGLAEPAVPPIPGQKEAYDPETGHSLYAGFATLYHDLGGRPVVGSPITEVIFRDGQVLQYFENLGFHRAENASPSETHLVALGLASRPSAESLGLDAESAVLDGVERQRPFASFLEPFGGESLFGQPLTRPYRAEDGALEQVYERAVVYAPKGIMRRAGFRPLGASLGKAEKRVPASREAGGMYFKETGHNVLWAFAAFYDSHDGRRLLGSPMSEAALEGDRLVQRFENGVLYYDFSLPSDLAVQLAPLGPGYLASHPAPTTEPEPVQVAATSSAGDGAPPALRIEAILSHAVVPPSAEQTLSVRVTDPDGSPVEGAQVTAQVTGPGMETTANLPDTNRGGQTTWHWLDADATPGAIVDLLVTASHGEATGSASLQFAYGFPASP